MALNSRFVSIGNEQLHYFEWGSGSKLLLAFHGYGDDARIFYLLKEYLERDYTIISVDLPHHGESQWRADKFTRDHLQLLANTLLQQYNHKQLSLVGYSLGGRIALHLLQLMPERIEQMVLLAPDGLERNYYYYFFTRTASGKRIFHHMMEQPGAYLKTIDLLRRIRVADAGRHKFARHFLEEERRRQFLLKVWPCMSDLVAAPATLKKLIGNKKMPVTIFMGAHDKIIPVAQARKFAVGLPTVDIRVLDKGHRLLDSETAPQIASALS